MAKASSRKGLWITLGVIALIVVSALTWYLMMKNDGPALVSVETVQRRTITQKVSAIGKLQPEVMVKISSEASGEIVYLGVRDGDTVHKNQLLARIQPDLVQTQLDQSRAATEASRLSISISKSELDRTEAEFKRVGDLYKKEYASREEYDRTRAAYEAASGRYLSSQADYQRSMGMLRQTQAQASRTTIFSPMNGIVTYLAVESGEKMVGTAQMQGTEMMRIADLNTMNAWVDVDENDVALISIGDTARVTIDALRDITYRGVVYEISHSPRVSGQGTQEEVVNFQVRIRLVDKDIKMRPGMSCNVEIETDTHTDVVAVPIQAVTVRQDASAATATDDDDTKVEDKRAAVQKRQQEAKRPPSIVWLVQNNKVVSRRIETSISDEGYIEVVKGLTDKDVVVTAPYKAVSSTLQDNMPVRMEDDKARRDRFKQMRQKPQ